MGEQMLKFCSLYSGSTGNSLFVENNNTKILIDAGVSGKKVVEALDSIDVNPEEIDAISLICGNPHCWGITTFLFFTYPSGTSPRRICSIRCLISGVIQQPLP